MNQLDITADQALATQRADLRGVVYLLSGTLPRNVAHSQVGDQVFHWSTQTASGLGTSFDGVLGPPVAIQRGASFDPRTGPSSPAIRIPIRNLPFAYSQSLLAMLVDEDMQWEGTTATLRVGYLKPGQAPEDLADADWTPLVLDGTMGAPQDITLDGFSIVLYPRGAKRNQVVSQRVVAAPSGGSSSEGLDKGDVGKPYPIVVGRPDSWFKLPTVDMVTRGFLVSGLVSGATTIAMRPLTSGSNLMKSSGGSNTTRVMIHNRTPAYATTTDFADVVYDPNTNILTFEIQSGLEAPAPAGAYVQEYNANGYVWALANHKLLTSGVDLTGAVGFRTADGRVTAVELSRWPFGVETPSEPGDAAFDDDLVTHLRLDGGTTGDPNVPILFVPFDLTVASGTAASVSVQPAFSSNAFLSSKIAYPASATGGTNPGNAVDGDESTFATQAASVTMIVTFSQTPPSPFGVNDTTNSTLHATIQGSPLFRNNNATQTYGSFAVGTGTNHRVRLVIGAGPEPFNENVRVTGNGATSFVMDIFWEHDLEDTASNTRDTDVAVTGGGGGGGAVNLETMEFADLVFRMPKNISGTTLLENAISGGTLVVNPWLETEDTGVAGQPIAHPTAALAGLQSLLLSGEGGLEAIAQDSYDAAHARFQAGNIRWNFVLLDLVRSWTDLEQQLAGQSRTDFWYGPSGHEMVFQESISGLAAAVPLQDFTLEGAPGANAVQGAGPLISRTGVSEIRNTVTVDYARDYAEDGRFQRSQTQLDAASVARMGTRNDPTGRFNFWAHSADTGNPNYDVDASVSGIVTHMAGRFASAHMRYTFRTAWVAHGLDRGSLVSVNYKVAPGQFRTHRCEVESIRTSPLPDELVDLTCRSVGATPANGLAAAQSGLEASVDMDGNNISALRTASGAVGIANTWSMGAWFRPDDIQFAKVGSVIQVRGWEGSDQENNILIRIRGNVAGQPVRVDVYDSAAVRIKRFDYLPTPVPRDQWSLILATFDGVADELKLYVNGVERVASSTPDDSPGTLTDTPDRAIGLGNTPSAGSAVASGSFYQGGLWNSVLTSGEQLALYANGDGRNTPFDTQQGASLEHWYRPGFDVPNMGKDYGVATSGVMPLLLSGTFMHAARIGRDAPGGA